MIILNGSNYSVLAGLNQQNEHMNEQCSYKNEQIEHTILITFFYFTFINMYVYYNVMYPSSVFCSYDSAYKKLGI